MKPTRFLNVLSLTALLSACVVQHAYAASTMVTDAVGTQQLWAFQDVLGAQKLVSKVNQVDGKGVSQTWDANGNRLTRTDAEGRVTSYSYNATNQKTSMTEAVGTLAERVTTYQYVSADVDLVTKVISPSIYTGNNKEVVTAYDANLNVTSVTITGFDLVGNPVSRTTSFTHDLYGKVTAIDGARTDVADVTVLDYYNCSTGAECGQLRKITNPLGHQTTFDAYDGAARLLQSTNANGVVTTYAYHPRGWLLSMTETPPTGAARVTSYEHDHAGQLTKATLPGGTEQHYVYDAAHDLTAVSDNLGNKIEYSYDAKGNQTQQLTKDPDGSLVRSVVMTFDIRNFVASVNTGGSVTQLVNDAVGNLSAQTDANLNPSTGHSFDPLDRLTNTLDALANNTGYQFNVADQLTQVTAPNGATTQYQYDDLGNQTKEISPDRGTIVYSHDDAGNVTSITDARGITSSYQYDALNRLTSISYPDASENIAYNYDLIANCGASIGHLCAVTDQSGLTEFEYDVWGNLTRHRQTQLGQTQQISYQHDAENRVTQISYPGGRVVDISRDVIGRITGIDTRQNNHANQVVSNVVNNVTYRADHSMTGVTFGNGLRETRRYDTQGRTLEIDLETAAGTVTTRQYQHDANGNILRIDHPQQAANDQDFGYDVLDRLIDSSGDYGALDYGYDPAGNRLQRDQSQQSQSSSQSSSDAYSYTANSNRLSRIDQNQQGVLDQRTITHDDSGNITRIDTSAGTVFSGSYNGANRLAQVTTATSSAQYIYNAFGQRTLKTVTENGTTTRTQYVYDQAGQLLSEINAAGQITREYIYLNGQPIATLITRAANDEFYLINKATGLKLRPTDGSDGSAIIATAASDNSDWTRYRQLPTSGDYFFLQNVQTGYYFRPKGYNNGSGLEQRPTSYSGARTQWSLNPADSEHYFLVNRWTGKHIRPNNAAVDGPVVQQPNTWTGNWTRWRLEAVSSETQSELYFIHNDHLMTPKTITAANQEVVWQASHTPFGLATLDTSTIENNIRFPGQYFDQETGLHYNWNRYYEPETGRYLTSDPIGLDGGLNTYGYVGGNPVIYIDPMGLMFGSGFGNGFGSFPGMGGLDNLFGDKIPTAKAVASAAGQCLTCVATCVLVGEAQSAAIDLYLHAKKLAEAAVKNGAKRALGVVGTIDTIKCSVECF